MRADPPHELFHATEEQMEAMQANGDEFVRLTNKQAAELKNKSSDERGEWLRKNRNRNKPCHCGSGLKFKKCCW